MKKRLAQAALRGFGCVGMEKIRRFKRKIARKGQPKPELWPYEHNLVLEIFSFLDLTKITFYSIFI